MPDPRSDAEPRWDLINHLKQQIARGPERYANLAKLRFVCDRLSDELHRELPRLDARRTPRRR